MTIYQLVDTATRCCKN